MSKNIKYKNLIFKAKQALSNAERARDERNIMRVNKYHDDLHKIIYDLIYLDYVPEGSEKELANTKVQITKSLAENQLHTNEGCFIVDEDINEALDRLMHFHLLFEDAVGKKNITEANEYLCAYLYASRVLIQKGFVDEKPDETNTIKQRIRSEEGNFITEVSFKTYAYFSDLFNDITPYDSVNMGERAFMLRFKAATRKRLEESPNEIQ